ncbi:hypothetical protein [Massilia antarctica]|uniref:hypothetical protein n=1 Tax=Massilia antarctica TaxID=2765360 RepID=UPI0006BB95BC|nr:hypothetical protein [Massilia sp. H27-R4]MCY0915174.1 hypothetical protein [Massilia sp. H27-R4]CUI07158.1 OSJNBa0083N12.5 [Janthinobacterium sp. CG23_2]CUU30944.1 OSJNBa0083N12.5 [Janthinobacterium sp. CG23_2]
MLLAAYDKWPPTVLAPERGKRAFISGVLARNEVNRDYAYNRRLFKRLSTGRYQFNPALALRRPGQEGDGWHAAFALLNLALVKELAEPGYADDIDSLLTLAGMPAAGEPLWQAAVMRHAAHAS